MSVKDFLSITIEKLENSVDVILSKGYSEDDQVYEYINDIKTAIKVLKDE